MEQEKMFIYGLGDMDSFDYYINHNIFFERWGHFPGPIGF